MPPLFTAPAINIPEYVSLGIVSRYRIRDFNQKLVHTNLCFIYRWGRCYATSKILSPEGNILKTYQKFVSELAMHIKMNVSSRSGHQANCCAVKSLTEEYLPKNSFLSFSKKEILVELQSQMVKGVTDLVMPSWHSIF